MRLIIEVPEKTGPAVVVQVSYDDLSMFIDSLVARIEDASDDTDAHLEFIKDAVDTTGTVLERLEAVKDAISALESHLAFIKTCRKLTVAFNEEMAS